MQKKIAEVQAQMAKFAVFRITFYFKRYQKKVASHIDEKHKYRIKNMFVLLSQIEHRSAVQKAQTKIRAFLRDC
jgi:hypothetical protein